MKMEQKMVTPKYSKEFIEEFLSRNISIKDLMLEKMKEILKLNKIQEDANKAVD